MVREHREFVCRPALAGSTRQKAREVYSNRLVHAMLVSRWIKHETLVLQ